MGAMRAPSTGGTASAGLLVLLVVLALATFLPSAYGADVTVQARLDAEQLSVGQSTTLAVEVQGTQDAAAPNIANVEGLTVRYVGPSTQISIVNGRMTSSITHRFSVAPQKAGRFTIGPITIPYQGDTLDGGSLAVTAVAAGTPTGGGRARGNAPAAGPGGNQLQLSLITPKTSVYLHERLPVTVRLSVGNVRVSGLEYPSVPGDGFALEAFPQPNQRAQQTTNGKVQIVEFRTILTPHRSGALTIGPATMAMNKAMQQRRGDPFFSSFFGGRQQAIEVTSEPIVLDVAPLPTVGRPASFGGGVGTFTMQISAAPREVTEGDPVTVTIKIRARGNLEQVTAPSFADTETLRAYPIQQLSAGGADTAAVQERVFEQVVIPERAGTETLPALVLGYFDPDAGAYRTTRTAPIPLRVTPRAGDDPRPQVVGASPQIVEKEETLGRDIVFIKDAPGHLVPIGSRLYRRPAFWLLQPLPLLAWLGVVLYDRRRKRLHGDAGYARFTRAGRAARLALAEADAARASGDRPAFYDQITRTVSEYLAAKLALPPGGVTADTVAARLDDQRIPSAVADEVRELFATCERVRFAPDAVDESDMQHTLMRATGIIRTVERARKLTIPMSRGLLLTLLCLVIAAGMAAAAENPVARFFRANELYGAERFADAAATYEQVLDQGQESAALHFNIGNAHFKDGDVGRAVLGYERARRMTPRDPDLAANLAYARTLSEEPDDVSLVRTLLVPLANRMSSDELVWTASLAYTVLMVLLIVMRLSPSAARTARLAAGGVAIALVLAGTSAAYRIATVDLPAWAVLVGRNEHSIRFEPSASGTEHFAAKPGRVLRILVERDTWVQVARRDGKRGWVERAALVPL